MSDWIQGRVQTKVLHAANEPMNIRKSHIVCILMANCA